MDGLSPNQFQELHMNDIPTVDDLLTFNILLYEVGENLNSSVVAETMKLLANSSYGYQIMDRSRQTVAKYLSDGKNACGY